MIARKNSAAVRAFAALGWTLVAVAAAVAGVAMIIERLYDTPLGPDTLRFERPWAGFLPLAVLVLPIVRGWLLDRRVPRLATSRGTDLLALPTRGRRIRWLALPPALRNACLALMGMALMGPQSVHARQQTDTEGIDIVLVLDMSMSMQAADIRPSRFEATKHVVADFVERRPHDRIGAVIFGVDAYTLLPLTTDKDVLRTMIGELELEMIDGNGTAIGNAAATALNRLRHSNAKSKVMILLTDGTSNSGNVSPQQAAEFASVMGVKVFTVLMGRADEAPVAQGRDLFGRTIHDVGSFPLDPKLLEDMAAQTGGEAFVVTDRQGLVRTFHTILDRLEKSQIEDQGAIYAELFPAFLWPALTILLLELVLGAVVLRRWP